jgi:hypothetical protein
LECDIDGLTKVTSTIFMILSQASVSDKLDDFIL